MLCVTIRDDLVRDFLNRTHDHIELETVLESLLDTWLSNNDENPDFMTDEHLDRVARVAELSHLVDDVLKHQWGDPNEGIKWGNLFLPNGTEVRSTYKGEDYFAMVREQRLMYENEPLTPSQFASKAAGNTSRNAWRDLWVKRPHDKSWSLADALRHGKVGYVGRIG